MNDKVLKELTAKWLRDAIQNLIEQCRGTE